MSDRFVMRALLALLTVVPVFAAPQGQPAAQTGQPVAKQPSVKSPAEGQALNAVFQAPDIDARIKAAEEFVTKFADSDFKGLALMVEAEMYRQKNNYEKMVIYGERALEADPKNYMAMLLLASGIAQRTQEFDLDREEKLGRVEKYARTAMDIVKAAPKPNPQLTDEQWAQAKGTFNSQAHEALAMAAMARKNNDAAIAEFKIAVESSNPPDPATQARLGRVYNEAKRYDDAIAILEKVIATPDIDPRIRQFAQAERARALKAKGVTSSAPAPSATPAPAAAPAPAAPPAPATAPAPAEPKKP